MASLRAWLPALLIVVGLAGCSSPSPVTTIFDAPRTADDELPVATSGIEGFVADSSRLLWEGVDATYYAAQGDGDPGTVICLIAVEGENADATCSARVPIGREGPGGEDVSLGETGPDGWTKRGTFFWSRD